MQIGSLKARVRGLMHPGNGMLLMPTVKTIAICTLWSIAIWPFTVKIIAIVMNRSQKVVHCTIGNLAAVFDPLCDRLAEVKPDEDAREPVFVCRLREAGV